ncbi:hypothetical protein HMN09_00023200 [Mycena chlorophos]|uniref:Uncharacterized protein n=1 Tax=Mycena chlorophos TaxID=658473 RepID=A0A8H6TVE1_MYCCL|nr:hypothetical protein HMN09_00023200 [Mycena chlorophos]
MSFSFKRPAADDAPSTPLSKRKPKPASRDATDALTTLFDGHIRGRVANILRYTLHKRDLRIAVSTENAFPLTLQLSSSAVDVLEAQGIRIRQRDEINVSLRSCSGINKFEEGIIVLFEKNIELEVVYRLDESPIPVARKRVSRPSSPSFSASTSSRISPNNRPQVRYPRRAFASMPLLSLHSHFSARWRLLLRTTVATHLIFDLPPRPPQNSDRNLVPTSCLSPEQLSPGPPPAPRFRMNTAPQRAVPFLPLAPPPSRHSRSASSPRSCDSDIAPNNSVTLISELYIDPEIRSTVLVEFLEHADHGGIAESIYVSDYTLVNDGLQLVKKWDKRAQGRVLQVELMDSARAWVEVMVRNAEEGVECFYLLEGMKMKKSKSEYAEGKINQATKIKRVGSETYKEEISALLRFALILFSSTVYE